MGYMFMCIRCVDFSKCMFWHQQYIGSLFREQFAVITYFKKGNEEFQNASIVLDIGSYRSEHREVLKLSTLYLQYVLRRKDFRDTCLFA